MVLRLSRPLNCARIVFRAFTCKSMCCVCCYPNLFYLAPGVCLLWGSGPMLPMHAYMQKKCDVAEKAILAKKNCGKSA